MQKFLFILCALPWFIAPTFAQDKLVIDDQAGILSGEAEQVIATRLSEWGIDYTSMVDFRDRCAYYFTALELSGNDLLLTVRDCNDGLLGAKNMGSVITDAPGGEQGLLLAYAIRDIVSEPGRYHPDWADSSIVKPGTAAQGTGSAFQVPDSLLSNEHDSRYYFAPSAFNLKKGELYYNAVYFVLHDIQYGISDHFSMGIGTSIIGLPIYLTPKLSIPLGKKNALALGDMPMFGTWGTDFMGNLAYGVFTHGNVNGNITLGAGHLYINNNEITNRTSSLVTNISALGRLTPYIFFLTENYLMSATFKRTASFEFYDPVTGYDFLVEDFEQRNIFWYGIMGVRIVSKTRNFIAWQVGITYIVNYAGDIPVKYLSPSWDHDARTPQDINLFAIPTVAFTVKFGKHY
jgi:hypothetical protein